MAKTILLADDSVTIQKVVELTFMDEDYSVVAVSDGTAALEQLPEVAPDLVIADVHMPGADGYEVCRRTKASHPSIPVLLLVGTFEQFDDEMAAAAGADGNLKKPFDSQELLNQVESLISGSAPAAEPSAEPPAVEIPLTAEIPQAEIPVAEFAPPPPEAAAPEAEDLFEVEPAAAETLPPVADLEPPPLLDEAEAASEDTHPMQARELEDAGEVFELAEESAPGEPEPISEPEPFPMPEVAETTPIDLEAPTLAPVEAAAAEPEAPEAPEAPAPVAAEPAAPEVAAEPAAPEAAAAESEAVAEQAGSNGALSDEEVERIARKVAEVVGEKMLREVAWEVIPDLAEVIIKERIRELESQVE